MWSMSRFCFWQTLTDLVIVSVLLGIFAYFTFEVIGIKKISFVSSLGIFKHSLLQYSQFPTRNYLCYIGDPSASTSHTRLRLNFSVLKYHLFQKNCCLSPACPLSDAPVEYPKHWFLYCPSCAALRLKTCLPPLHNYPDIDSIVLPIRKKIDWFLNGISNDEEVILTLLCFFSKSNRLFPCPTVSVNFYSSVLCFVRSTRVIAF